jgi:hypothetical protein
MMTKRIPGPHDEQVLPIQQADQEIKASFQDVLDHFRRLTQQVNSRYIIGFRILAICQKEKYDLEDELRRAADALAAWRKVSQGMTEEKYYQLLVANEEARKEKKKENRPKR